MSPTQPDRIASPNGAAYEQFRAPEDDGAALVSPAWPAQLRQLAAAPTAPAVRLAGASLTEIAASARRDLLRIAAEHTGAEPGTDAGPASPGPLVVSGHQPELFHPGVWFKNFALDALARASGGVGVHLLIDSDLCRTPSVAAPTGTVNAPRLTTIAYDQPVDPTPHEERRIVDTSMWDSFATRLAEAVSAFCPRPVIRAIWLEAIAAGRRGATLGEAISHARHHLERRHGLTTLEAPMSCVCDTESFRRFAAELLIRSAESRDAYNGALADYREAHGLRNAAQPLPYLAAGDGWCEVPLWVWSLSDRTRRPLWARTTADGVELRDDSKWRWRGPREGDGLVEALGRLRGAGVKVRSRALATTLFCRLVLADLFLHGIGGAKYDQVTDRWSQRLLGVAPPPHATLSATLRLPAAAAVSAEEPTRLRRELRGLRYHPEVGLPPGVATEARDAKRLWIEMPKTPANAAERHAAIVHANEAMHAARAAESELLRERIDRAVRDSRARRLLGSREFSFGLFAEQDIVPRLKGLAKLPDLTDESTP